MLDREPMKMIAEGKEAKIAWVTFRAFLTRGWIYRAGEENGVVTYKITEAGRKVL